jgi:hypothetical protein
MSEKVQVAVSSLLSSMERIAADLPLLDLDGGRVSLGKYLRNYLLLIFLRHLA